MLLLSGCAVGPDYHPQSGASLGVPQQYSVAADEQPRADLTHWWTSFNDPLLTQLVGSAEATNLDVAQALTRLRQARESLVQSRASLLPSLSASGTVSRNQNLRGGTSTYTLPDGTVTSITTGNSTSFSIGADASYQADLFGGNLRSVQAARASLAASGYNYADVLITVQGEIARNYILARLYQAQLTNARNALSIQDDNLQIAQWRVQAGLVSSLDQEQARQQRAQTAATIPSLENSYNQAVSRLGVLTGQAPGALKTEMEKKEPIPQGPSDIAVGIPADTLRQRPDVRAAERDLAAATAQIGVAKAQLFPQFNIGGSIDSSANALSSLTNIITGRLFATIAQTIFDGGRQRAQVRSNEAAAQGAFYNYKQTVLSALEDVENGITALDTAEQRERDYTTALNAANNAAILSRSQYRAGLTDFTTLNQAESALLSAANSLSQARADRANALIQLYGALGGGWQSDTAPTTPLDQTTTNGKR
ncbi:efflux transporter outer membrane subunit [Stakelama sediminis]|uniref:NodT family efflux transporter outer membrane factor (OMF) lipoprotein n=1 Tax=Stakelama sediminis TaxID=463200 RepID=A0A840YX04_9SPHN|nr:efflux transporter outer membrane subunit [Stakelama sediminis]MBB5718064.1 NodT family efflux transporter outer membrane factor (OMF) lipoprotein [Stakelama sediminis]